MRSRKRLYRGTYWFLICLKTFKRVSKQGFDWHPVHDFMPDLVQISVLKISSCLSKFIIMLLLCNGRKTSLGQTFCSFYGSTLCRSYVVGQPYIGLTLCQVDLLSGPHFMRKHLLLRIRQIYHWRIRCTTCQHYN